MSEPQKTVQPAPICQKCLYSLVHGAKFKESDPWQVLSVATQLTLFQATTPQKKAFDAIGGDIMRIAELGCLGCYNPDVLTRCTALAKIHKKGQFVKYIKEYGESFLSGAQQ